MEETTKFANTESSSIADKETGASESNLPIIEEVSTEYGDSSNLASYELAADDIDKPVANEAEVNSAKFEDEASSSQAEEDLSEQVDKVTPNQELGETQVQSPDMEEAEIEDTSDEAESSTGPATFVDIEPVNEPFVDEVPSEGESQHFQQTPLLSTEELDQSNWLYLHSKVQVCSEPPYRNPISTLADLAYHYERWRVGRRVSEVFEIGQLWWELDFEDLLENYQFEHAIRFVNCSFPTISFEQISGVSLQFVRCQFAGDLCFVNCQFEQGVSLSESLVEGILQIARQDSEQDLESTQSELNVEQFTAELQLHNSIIKQLRFEQTGVERLCIDRSLVHFTDSQFVGLNPTEILISRSMISGHGYFENCPHTLIESSYLQDANLSFEREPESQVESPANEQAQLSIIWSSCSASALSVYDPSLVLSIESCVLHCHLPSNQQSLLGDQSESYEGGLLIEQSEVAKLSIQQLALDHHCRVALNSVIVDEIQVDIQEADIARQWYDAKQFMALDTVPVAPVDSIAQLSSSLYFNEVQVRQHLAFTNLGCHELNICHSQILNEACSQIRHAKSKHQTPKSRP